MREEYVFPGTLEQALTSEIIYPGDRVFLHAGTYTGDFVCSLLGTADNPITIMSYPGEHAIIDGSLTIGGAYTIWQDLEAMYSGWVSRSTEIAGSDPADIPDEKVINVTGVGCKLINLLVHDMAGGIGFWTPAVDAEIYGCVIWNNGWSGPDRGHGHSFYTQNNTGTKLIKNCIALNSFSTGLKIYTEGGNAHGYNIVGNTIFDSAVLFIPGTDYGMNYWIQDPNPGTGYRFEANMSYHSLETGDAVRLGLYDYQYGVTLLNNYWPEGVVKNCEVVEETGNYYGADLGNQVFLRANDYDADRANLTIYNQAEANTIAVDVSAVFDVGDTINARNVQDYFVDIQELTVAADGIITVNMTGRTVSTPIGWDAPATTFPQFGCFVLERVA